MEFNTIMIVLIILVMAALISVSYTHLTLPTIA